MPRVARSQRQQFAQRATDVRLRCLRDGAPTHAIVDAICKEVTQILPLEAFRLANGWSRPEVGARLDALYEADGLAPLHITSAELCRWEHGQRRPGDERIEYLCRLYETRPDRLGFGIDFGKADIGHLAHAGIPNLWPTTTPEALADLVERIKAAQEEISHPKLLCA